jgi:hypothetical protein
MKFLFLPFVATILFSGACSDATKKASSCDYEIINDSTAFRQSMGDCKLRKTDFENLPVEDDHSYTSFTDQGTGLVITGQWLVTRTQGPDKFMYAPKTCQKNTVDLFVPEFCNGIWLNYAEFNGKATNFILWLNFGGDQENLAFPLPSPVNTKPGSNYSFGVKTRQKIVTAKIVYTDTMNLKLDNIIF